MILITTNGFERTEKRLLYKNIFKSTCFYFVVTHTPVSQSEDKMTRINN